MKNELAVSKQTVVEYVNDSVDLETRIYTLEQGVKMCLEEADKLEEKVKRINNENYGAPIKPIAPLEPTLKKLPELRYDGYVSYWFWRLIPSAILMILPTNGIIMSSMEDSLDGAASYGKAFLRIYIVLTLICTSLFAFYSYTKSKKRVEEKYFEETLEIEKENNEIKKKYDNDYSQYQSELGKYYSDKEEYYKKRDDMVIQAENFKIQAERTSDDLRRLYAQRDTFYSVGIVPPDYRTLDCVCVLDQIFRNDLADNVREAIKIYEERVFRGDVIRGIGAIADQLGMLNGLMLGIGMVLTQIENTVNEMSSDIYRVSGKLTDISEQNKEIVYNSSLSVFAASSIQASVDKISKYQGI